MDGKARVAEYIIHQPTSPMKWTIHTSVMYIDMLNDMLGPVPSPDDPSVFVFTSPTGKAKQPLIYLDDIGSYAKWIFENPDHSNGIDLQVSTANVAWEGIAKSFTEVTGKKAIYKQITLEEAFERLPFKDTMLGADFDPRDPSLMMGKENFNGMWHTMMADTILPRIDYTFLDKILPTRVKTVEEWMRLVGYTGISTGVLKENDSAQ